MHLPKPCFQLVGFAISKAKLLRLVFIYFSIYMQKQRTFVRRFAVYLFVNTFWSCYPDLNWGPHPDQLIGILSIIDLQDFPAIFLSKGWDPQHSYVHYFRPLVSLCGSGTHGPN